MRRIFNHSEETLTWSDDIFKLIQNVDWVSLGLLKFFKCEKTLTGSAEIFQIEKMLTRSGGIFESGDTLTMFGTV